MKDLYQVISTKLSTIDISKRWLILPYRLIGDMFWYLRCVYKIYLYVLLIQPLCHYQTYHTQRWNLLSICHLYHNNDVDKKHHRCTGDIVLKINVGTTRTRYSYNTISKRGTMTKSLLRTNPPPLTMMLSTRNLYWHIRHKI